MKTLSIVGRGWKPTIHRPNTTETWVVGSAFDLYEKDLGHVTKIWDCHDLVKRGEVIDIRHESTIRSACKNVFGKRFSNQLCWMVAWALLMHDKPSVIYIIGAPMIEETYSSEVANLAYLIGRAEEKGIPVLIEQPSAILPEHLYPQP